MFILGDVPVDDTLYCPFDTFDSDGASVTITGLAVTDIEIYKDGVATTRASDNGYALLDTDGIDFDGAVGLHGFSVDLSDNSDAGFYAAGSAYWVNVNAITVDSQTVRFTYHFTIGKLLRPTTAGRTLDVDANDRVDVGSWLGTVVTTSSTTNKPEVDQFSISDDATAANNLELQYDTTGLSGDTFPSTQSQVSQIGSGGGAANNEFVIAAPNGFVITTGSGEVNDEDATVAGGGTVHQISDTAGTMDVYYLFDIGGSFTPRNIVHEGRANGNNQDLGVYVNTNTQASPTWVQRATLLGSALSTNIRRIWPLAAGDLMVGADAGKVAVRFQATGLSSATLTTDQILVEKGSISSLVGYANGQVWVDTVNGTAGTVVNVNGVADKAVDLWASAITIASSAGLADDFHIINGSTIALTGTSDNFSLFGDNWTLQLESRSVAGAYFQGAHVSGVGTSATEVHYEGCDVATMSVQIGHFDFCSFSGTVTHTLAGDYNYHNCYSMVAGPNGPTFAKTAGQTITAQWRGWAGSINLTGLETGDTLTIGGAELGTIDLGSPAGAPVVEIRGIYKEFVNVGSASVNLDGAILAADVALILGDTNELQGVLSAGILARSNNPNLNALLGVDDAASKTIGHTIWDKVLSKANHDIAQSAAKLLRQLASFVIANNDARVTGSPGINQIQLAASESSVDGTFDPGIVGIVDGTGAGQCRMILEYDGTSKIATLNRDWKVAPDATSEYVILCSEGGLHVNEGLAQAGGALSITLNSLASITNDVYNGQFIFLVSGAGQDQVGRVTAYNGTTKVATIETTMNGWAVQPDATTGYIMIPILDTAPTLLGTPIALDGGATTIAAMLTKMADDNGGADFDATTDSQNAIAADLPSRPTKNVALANFPFLMVLTSDHVTGATGLTVVCQRSIDGGAYANCTNTPATEVANGSYKIDLSAADRNGDQIMYKFTAATADTRFILIVSQPT